MMPVDSPWMRMMGGAAMSNPEMRMMQQQGPGQLAPQAMPMQMPPPQQMMPPGGMQPMPPPMLASNLNGGDAEMDLTKKVLRYPQQKPKPTMMPRPSPSPSPSPAANSSADLGSPWTRFQKSYKGAK